jgi:coenzyme F420-reducing hydrogenase beta subunit/polysaccharide pyruvyl transferase WcaK-like protein
MELSMPSERAILNISDIVVSNLCVGCGLCCAVCPNEAIGMVWQDNLTWQPVVAEAGCINCGRCRKVCPNSPQCIMEYAAAAQAQGARFGLAAESKYFIAYDKDASRRIRSASGGVTSVLLEHLLTSGVIDGVLAVLPLAGSVGAPHFEMKIFRSVEELCQGRGSHYHTPSYDKVLREIAEGAGSFAVVGVPCVLRGLNRLPLGIRGKIKFKLGLVCGKSVTGAFSDCLAVKEGVEKDVPYTINLRDKIGIPDANNYNNLFILSNREIRRNRFATAFTAMWRNYFFAQECCLYCADFYGVDADVSIKDAWGRLSGDPLGTSLVIVNNPEIVDYLSQSKAVDRLFLEECDADEIFNSQTVTPIFKHEKIRDRLVWKKSIKQELDKSYPSLGWSRRWLSRDSHEFWRLWALMKVSEFFYLRIGKVPVKGLLLLLCPLKVNGMLLCKAGKRLKHIVLWPWRAILRPVLKAALLFAGYRRSKRVVDKAQLRVLVAGGYGYGNVGDEAQLAANLQHWKIAVPACRLTVLTPNPAYTQQVHNQVRVELAPRKALFGLRGREYFGSEKKFKRFYFPLSAWSIFNACLVRAGLPTFGLTTSQARLLDELKGTDVLFLSGGGYLTGMTLTRLWDHMLLIRLAYALGVPTILSGQTIGVFKDPISRVLARWGLEKAELIYLRDPVDSPEALAGLGISADRYKSTFDDALFFGASSHEKVEGLFHEAGGDPRKPYLAVNVHYWGQGPESSRVIMKSVAKILDRVWEEFNLQIVFVPMALSDEIAIDEVMTAMERPGIMPRHGYQPDLAVALIQKSALCMTMKHHPIIFAMAAAVPTVSMTFDDYYFHKNFGAMKIFHQENYVIKCTPEELEEKLYAAIKKVYFNRFDLSQYISTVVEELKSMSGEVIEKFMTDKFNK